MIIRSFLLVRSIVGSTSRSNRMWKQAIWFVSGDYIEAHNYLKITGYFGYFEQKDFLFELH